MENALIIFRQLAVMFVYIAIGYVLIRTKVLDRAGGKTIANLLVYLIIPCVVVNSFAVERTAENTGVFLWSLLAAVCALALSMLVSALLFHNRPIDNFGAAFSNAGFMGIPLVASVLGQDAVFSVTAFVALLNVLQWTYGQAILAKDWKVCSPKTTLTSPLILSFLLGMLVFFLRVPVPGLVRQCLTGISALNGPLAMIVLGAYLAEGRLRDIFTDRHIYVVSAVRQLLIPALTLLILRFFPAGDMRMAVLIVAAAPVGANVAVYAGKLGGDYPYAARTVCLSTLLSVLTMPATVALAGALW